MLAIVMAHFAKLERRPAVALVASAITAALAFGAAATTPIASARAHAAATQIGAYTTRGAWSYQSAPKLHPPRLHEDIKTQSNQLAPGYFLTANFPNVVLGKELVGQGGPLILDSHLQPVWFNPAPTSVVTLDLKQQTYNGKPALSYWEGVITSTGATSSGTVYVVDQHYRQVAKLTGDTAHGWVISPHEVSISGHDAWVTSYKYLNHVDLSAYGGSADGILYDSAVQEYDLTSGKLLYTWDAYNPGGTPNIPLSQSEGRAPALGTIPWDAYHENAVQLVGNDEFLVSMRNTWAAYLVNFKTNQVVWTLGGKNSSFTIPAADQFAFQHNVLLLANDRVTVYDDHCCAILGGGKFAPPTGPSRGLELQLDTTHHTASLVHQYTHGANFDSAFTGSMQLIPGGNALVGWGSLPFFTEYSAAGKMLLDAVWPTPDLSYRVLFTNNWVGTPYFPPRGAVARKHGRTTVYASWDGATQVVGWQVLAGPNSHHLKVVAQRNRTGFETQISLGKSNYKVYKVRALDRKGHTLGTSSQFPVHNGSLPPQGY